MTGATMTMASRLLFLLCSFSNTVYSVYVQTIDSGAVSVNEYSVVPLDPGQRWSAALLSVTDAKGLGDGGTAGGIIFVETVVFGGLTDTKLAWERRMIVRLKWTRTTLYSGWELDAVSEGSTVYVLAFHNGCVPVLMCNDHACFCYR